MYVIPFPNIDPVIFAVGPLAILLQKHDVARQSHASSYFRAESDKLVEEALGLSETTSMFGRTRTIRTAEGRLLARTVEMIPA